MAGHLCPCMCCRGLRRAGWMGCGSDLTLLESWMILTLSAPNFSPYSFSSRREISERPVSFGSL